MKRAEPAIRQPTGLRSAPADSRSPAAQRYRTSSPVIARPMSIRWISEVPSKIVKILRRGAIARPGTRACSRSHRGSGSRRRSPAPPSPRRRAWTSTLPRPRTAGRRAIHAARHASSRAASTDARMSASWKATPWFCPIGRPNWVRVREYSVANSAAARRRPPPSPPPKAGMPRTSSWPPARRRARPPGSGPAALPASPCPRRCTGRGPARHRVSLPPCATPGCRACGTSAPSKAPPSPVAR